MLVENYGDPMETQYVSVAGCLGYDVLVAHKSKGHGFSGFSCWLFRL